jgi:hypothetical protein
MSGLTVFSYVQPVTGSNFRFGILKNCRDCKKDPLARKTLNGRYREGDPDFERSKTLEYIAVKGGTKAFYKERMKWRITIPFIGSLIKPFLK